MGLLLAALLFAAGCTQQPATTTCSPTGGSTCPVITESAVAAKATPATPVATPAPAEPGKKVRLETDMGTIVIALDPAMPVTAGNFETLVKNKFYDGVTFHRVIDGFMIQGGDPTGTGRGGPGYVIQDEFSPANRNDRGTIAMANAGPNTGGSQFFINLVNNNYLDSMHPVFGRVVEGMDVVDKIGKVQTTGNPQNRPLRNITIIRAVMV
jgi:peptidylprolyl isomerase